MMNDKMKFGGIGVILVVMAVLTSAALYSMNAQLKSIANQLKEQSQTGSSLGQLCMTSGGTFQNDKCACGRDYVLENGKCMGQDGLTQKELDEIKAGQERLMQQSSGEDRVLMRMQTDLGLGQLTFTHACKGEVVLKNSGADMDGEYPPAHCKGENILTVVRNNERPVELLRVSSQNVEDAPLLQKVQAAGHAAEFDHVLISFGPNTCALNDDYCGVGMPENYVTHLMNDELKMVKVLKNYPMLGRAVLGNMRAAFIATSCGGAGCDRRAIVGYDFLEDKIVNLTRETAASEANATDVRGTKLPYWKSLRYNAPQDKFEAVYIGVDGAEQKILINGNF